MAPGPENQDRDRLLSTGKVAKLLSVTPDTVLKWIKSGRLRASRTAGGHYRIAQDDIEALTSEDSESQLVNDDGFLYCWEYYAADGKPGESCLGCLVYRTRARRCYEMSDLGPETGYAGTYCTETCDECAYFQEVVNRSRRVLMVTDSDELRRRLQCESSDSRIDLDFVSSEYECSTACHHFRPEFVVIDGSLPEAMRASLCSHLAADSRVPGVQIILVNDIEAASRSGDTKTRVRGELPRAFRLRELEDHIIGLEVKQPIRA